MALVSKLVFEGIKRLASARPKYRGFRPNAHHTQHIGIKTSYLLIGTKVEGLRVGLVLQIQVLDTLQSLNQQETLCTKVF